MDVSGEVADLLVRETLQAGEAAVKLAATGVKNAAALLLALSRSDRKVVGRTSAKKLARDPTPAVVLPLRTEDLGRFRKLAGEYGILYVIAKPHGKSGPSVDLISTERYAAKLNALYQAMCWDCRRAGPNMGPTVRRSARPSDTGPWVTPSPCPAPTTSWPGSRRSWPIQEDEEETHAETTGERPWR